MKNKLTNILAVLFIGIFNSYAGTILILAPREPANELDKIANRFFADGLKDLSRSNSNFVTDMGESSYNLLTEPQKRERYSNFKHIIRVMFKNNPAENYSTMIISATPLNAGVEVLGSRFIMYSFNYNSDIAIRKKDTWLNFILGHLKDLCVSPKKTEICISTTSTCSDESMTQLRLLDSLKHDGELIKKYYFHNSAATGTFIRCASTGDCGQENWKVSVSLKKQNTPGASSIIIFDTSSWEEETKWRLVKKTIKEILLKP